MADNSGSKRLDVVFQIARDTVLYTVMPKILTAIENRLSVLDDREASYQEAIDQLRNFALARINEVLEPAYKEINEILNRGFDSSKISDARAFGRSVLGTETRQALMRLLDLKPVDLPGVAVPADIATAVGNLNRELGQSIETNRADASGRLASLEGSRGELITRVVGLENFSTGYGITLQPGTGGVARLGGRLLLQYGTAVAVSNELGDSTIILPVSYIDKPIIIPTNGDYQFANVELRFYDYERIKPGSFIVTTYESETNVVVANKLFRCNYIALGPY